jgi:hypothetical protein
MEFIRFILVLLGPGVVAAGLYGYIARLREEPKITTTIAFSMMIYVIMITGLYYFKGIYTSSSLLVSFDCLSFTRKYALLSTFIGLILAVILGLIRKIMKLLSFPFFV